MRWSSMKKLLVMDEKNYSPDLEEIYRVSVRGIIFIDGKLLMIEDDFGEVKLPGGGADDGEDDYQALVREVKEETGLTISSPQLCGIKQWPDSKSVRYIVLFYKTDKFEGELKSSAEGEVFWMDLEEFKKAELAKDMLDMLDVFLDDDKSEFFYYHNKIDGEWKYEIK